MTTGSVKPEEEEDRIRAVDLEGKGIVHGGEKAEDTSLEALERPYERLDRSLLRYEEARYHLGIASMEMSLAKETCSQLMDSMKDCGVVGRLVLLKQLAFYFFDIPQRLMREFYPHVKLIAGSGAFLREKVDRAKQFEQQTAVLFYTESAETWFTEFTVIEDSVVGKGGESSKHTMEAGDQGFIQLAKDVTSIVREYSTHRLDEKQLSHRISTVFVTAMLPRLFDGQCLLTATEFLEVYQERHIKPLYAEQTWPKERISIPL